MKRAILAAVFFLILADLCLWLTPSHYLAALPIWLTRQSECSLQQFAGDLRSATAMEQTENTPKSVRTENGLELWQSPQRTAWSVQGDKMIGFLFTEQSRDIYEPTGHEVHQGDIVLDCGANIGMFTRTALDKGAARVIAIEPSPKTLEALRRNFEREIREGRVTVYPAGVWDQDSEIELAVDANNLGNSSMIESKKAAGQRVRVPVTTIDRIVSELNLPRVDFIKMDIEGAEKHALKGAQATIRRFRPRMSISLEHLDDDFTAIPAEILAMEPRYTTKPCDCSIEDKKIKALVMAFDPVQPVQ
ncbi:MAG: FkbM family methyltransferase [Bryobacteraceae bacterium]